LMSGTVAPAPGQYVDQDITQIVNTEWSPVGAKFRIDGSPADAMMKFPRISVHLGETLFGFAERLCRMRNLHMIDDGHQTMIAYRGPNGKSTASLIEGVNILRARLLLKNDEKHEPLVNGYGSSPRAESADAANVVASAPVVASVASMGTVPMHFSVEDVGNQKEAQLRVNHQVDETVYQTIDGDITTQGWLTGDGSLWIRHVRQIITVQSPMLIPGGRADSMQFMIKGVVHRQSNEDGTTTSVLLCDKNGRGSGGGEALVPTKGDGPDSTAPATLSDHPSGGAH
jgi:prophage tail gpP-like protein